VSVQCPQCDHPASPEAVSSGVCERCGCKLAAVPAIDISQLARLDELTGAPGAGGAQAAKVRDPLALPPVEPPPGNPFAPPPGAFGPAGEAQDEQDLAVERSTRAIRIANQLGQQPAARPPAAPPSEAPRSAAARPPAPAGIAAAGVQVRGMAILIALVLVLAIVVVAIVIQRS